MAQITLTLFFVLLSQLVEGVPLESQAAVVTASRIVGGTDAPDGFAPHMMGLVYGDLRGLRSFMCGAAIISKEHVMTAAHCIDALLNFNGTIMQSLRGVYGSNRWESTEKNVEFSSYKNHERWDPRTIKFDFGIYFIANTVRLIESDTVSPIPLGLSFVGGGKECYVTGWGRVSDMGPIPAVLQHINVTTLDGKTCRDAVSNATGNLMGPSVDNTIEICTIHQNGTGHGMCNGDSGSALVYKDYKTDWLVGLISWGFPCARGAPDMSARISPVVGWIKNTTMT